MKDSVKKKACTVTELFLHFAGGVANFGGHLLCQAVESPGVDLVDLVVVERQAGDFGEAPEGRVLDDGDVVLVQVDVVELPKLPERLGRHVVQLVVGEDEMLEVAGQGGEAVGHHAAHVCQVGKTALVLPPPQTISTQQSWALEVFFNFFNNKKIIVCIFIKLI